MLWDCMFLCGEFLLQGILGVWDVEFLHILGAVVP